jgi:hypothetical protein
MSAQRVEHPPHLPELPAAWPVDVVGPVLSRYQRLAAELGPGDESSGPTLELWRADSRRLVRDAAFLATGLSRTGEAGESASPAVVPQPASFATIVSVASLVHFADLPLAIRGLAYLLEPDGEVHLIEPIATPGAAAFLGASLTAGLQRWLPAVRGVHLHRDVPTALRTEGFTVGSIERFSMPSAGWSLRFWMHGSAVRIEPFAPAAAAAEVAR